MDKSSVVRTLARFRASLEEKGISVHKMILYGSYARGNYGEDSDIDVVVLSHSFSDKDLWMRIDMLTPALIAFDEPIEAIALTPEEWEKEESLIILYAKEGEVVYAA